VSQELPIKCEVDAASIVLRGSFNPAIIQPRWLGAKGLVMEAEATDAKVEIITPDVSSFAMGWVHLQVTTDKFSATALEAGRARSLRDLVNGIFGLLEHTPLQALGMNRTMHFRLPGEVEWHAVGDLLVPKDPWKELIEKPGMLSVVVQGRIAARPKALTNIKVEPSARIKPGVFVEVNEHYGITEIGGEEGLLRTLRDAWEDAQQDAKRIAEKMVAKGAG